MVKVKICGITNREDALAAVKAGADALGFVFYPESSRYVLPEEASLIIRSLPARIEKAGVFVNSRETTVRRIKDLCGLTMLQFHGNESPEFCRRFRGVKTVKALRVQERPDPAFFFRYDIHGFLLDSFAAGKAGGTGTSFDWSFCEGIDAGGKQLFLSGGLTCANVREAVRRVRPDWVDVSSGVEAAPGKKDAAMVREFIRRARQGI
jgi:phosphoribosylanthranilate isomerase